MSMKKNEETRNEVLRMYFEEKKSSNEIVEIMKDRISRPYKQSKGTGKREL